MAKAVKAQSKVPARTENRSVSTTKSAPAYLAKRMASSAGKGVSKAQEDNLVPLIYVLQPLSPQVNKRNAAYLDGAEPGMIWLRNSADPLVDGEEGIVFQPCFFTRDYVEWIPRDSGGGFVGRHETPPKDTKEEVDPKNPNKKKLVRKNGNEIIETRSHVGFVHLPNGQKLPYVIPFTSTGHSVSRQWMFMMNSKVFNGETIPSFAYLYRLKTKPRSNVQGEWFVLDVSDEDWASEEDIEAGEKLHDAFATGQKQIAELDNAHLAKDDDM